MKIDDGNCMETNLNLSMPYLESIMIRLPVVSPWAKRFTVLMSLYTAQDSSAPCGRETRIQTGSTFSTHESLQNQDMKSFLRLALPTWSFA